MVKMKFRYEVLCTVEVEIETLRWWSMFASEHGQLVALESYV